VKNFAEAEASLGKRDRRKLENHTYLERRENGSIAVKLHATDVVTYLPNGRTVLASGGYRTSTTKDRLIRYGGVPITQERGVWYMGARNHKQGTFRDGVTLLPDGTPDPHTLAHPDTEREVAALRKRIREYAGAYAELLVAGEIPEPSGGDCWGCYLRAEGEPVTTEVMGTHHYLLHLGGTEEQEEPYYVPSLVVNALRFCGAGPAWYWGLFSSDPAERFGGITPRQDYARFIRRFLYRQLGLG
jgi:hypothetical protein